MGADILRFIYGFLGIVNGLKLYQDIEISVGIFIYYRGKISENAARLIFSDTVIEGDACLLLLACFMKPIQTWTGLLFNSCFNQGRRLLLVHRRSPFD
jgi:hypothetical protein